MIPAIPRPVLVALGPAIGVLTVLAALDGTDAPSWVSVPLVGATAAGLALAGSRGGDVTLTIGLGAIGVAAGFGLWGDGTVSAAVLWAVGAVAAGEAAGLARRTRSVAAPDATVVTAELAFSALVIGATLVGGLVLLGAGDLPGPDGLVGEALALGAVIGLGALIATTAPGRSALRALFTRRP